MTKIVKPELSYNLVQVCKEVDDFMHVTYSIVNEDNETIRQFAEDDSERAYKIWWSYLTRAERALWEEYEMQCEVAAECCEQDRAECLIGNY